MYTLCLLLGLMSPLDDLEAPNKGETLWAEDLPSLPLPGDWALERKDPEPARELPFRLGDNATFYQGGPSMPQPFRFLTSVGFSYSQADYSFHAKADSGTGVTEWNLKMDSALSILPEMEFRIQGHHSVYIGFEAAMAGFEDVFSDSADSDATALLTSVRLHYGYDLGWNITLRGGVVYTRVKIDMGLGEQDVPGTFDASYGPEVAARLALGSGRGLEVYTAETFLELGARYRVFDFKPNADVLEADTEMGGLETFVWIGVSANPAFWNAFRVVY